MNKLLTLISLGPGGLEYLPPIARQAIESAEIVIGYRLYLDFIRPLLSPTQTVIESALGEEMDRANRAIDLAAEGKRAALVSSGDVGIYAMAGPVYEALRARNWQTGDRLDSLEVQVIPGISALQAAAAQLGAPMAHDFCAISLSDLHTDWAVIARRIDAAGRGDFVIAFFNPRSRERDWQLVEAQRILLLHRSPDTPVALARSVTRPEEQITLTTLGALDVTQVDMFTLVIVGNSQTARLGGQLATPRGYTVLSTDTCTGTQVRCGTDEWDDGNWENYPITFTTLRNVPVVVVGGGPVAERKTRGLLAAGARVRLIAPQITSVLQKHIEAGEVEWVTRPYRAGDVMGARLAFAATNDRAVNAAIARECRAAGIPVNVADSSAECAFTLPAVARRDGLTIAVNTAEHDPSRAARVRDRLLQLDDLG